MKLIKRYSFFIGTCLLLLIMFLVNYNLGQKALGISFNSVKEVAFIIPPIFILLGLLDVWVSREAMMKYMGEESGLIGISLAFFLGSAAAGPLYAAFPIAAVLMKKGVKFSNILIFIGAWSTTKIPMLLFELSSLGAKFTFTRLLINIPGIIIISYVISSFIDENSISQMRSKTYKMAND